MIPFVALFAFRQAQQLGRVSPLETVEDATDFVQSLGYVYLPGEPNRGNRRFAKSGVEFRVVGWSQTQANKAERKPPRVVGLFLTLELATPRQLSLLRTRAPEVFGAFGETSFVPHLGQSVTITKGISLGEGATEASVKADLDRLWTDAASYAQNQGTTLVAMPEINWTRYRFDERINIDRADEVSLYRLAQSWGWTFRPKGPGGRSGGGWLIWTTIDDRQVDFAEGSNDGSDPTSFIVSSSFTLPVTADPETWAAEKEKAYRGLAFFASKDQRAGARMSVDLGKGVTLGDLRRRIQGFADLMRSLQRDSKATQNVALIAGSVGEVGTLRTDRPSDQ